MLTLHHKLSVLADQPQNKFNYGASWNSKPE